MKQEKSCGALIFHEENQDISLLLIKHRNGGHWSFPKGHMENGETEPQTALREILEETGLKVQLFTDFRKSVSYQPKPDINKEVVYFVAISDTQEIQLQEEEVRQGIWVDPPRALTLVTYENDRHLIQTATEFYENMYQNKRQA